MIDHTKEVDIDSIFEEGESVDRAIAQAAWVAVQRHKSLNQPIVVWRDNQPVWIPAEEINWSAPPAERLD